MVNPHCNTAVMWLIAMCNWARGHETTVSGAVGMNSLRGALFRRLAISIFGMESVRLAEC